MGRRQDLTGQRFERLVVVSDAGANRHGQLRWLCRCDCGGEKVIVGLHLKSGNTRSCGCLQPESASTRSTIHSHANPQTPTYMSWASMKARTSNQRHRRWDYYGGRGITVCERWKKFENFLEDMGEKPAGRSLDRIDNDGNYEPENCRWSTQKEQCRNKRNTLFLSYQGRRLSLRDWSEATGISHSTLRNRMLRGMSDEAVLTAPVRAGKHRAA